MKIIYPDYQNNGVCVITPSGLIPVIQTALSDVPKGLPFIIIDDDNAINDRTFREAWECDFSNPDGYGADYGADSDFGVYRRDKLGNARLIANGNKESNTIEFKLISTNQCRKACDINPTLTTKINVNIDKAKLIAHDIRREKREKEFAPFDDVIIKQIPGTDFKSVEESRESIRLKYAIMQEDIDKAVEIEEIKNTLLS